MVSHTEVRDKVKKKGKRWEKCERVILKIAMQLN